MTEDDRRSVRKERENSPTVGLEAAHGVARKALRSGRALVRRARTEADWRRSRQRRADVAVFHEFVASPYGGGNQFLLALVGELERRGLTVEANRISGGTPACLVNSFNFDARRLRRFAARGARIVHRVDGPVSPYRGFDDGTDALVARINHDLAAATIVQSRYSLEKHRQLGLRLREPVVILNSVDPAIFFPPIEREPLTGRRLRLIATSWSDNPRKGADVLAWLDRHLDWNRYEMTFVGRTPVSFRRIRMLGPVGSEQVADLLRSHDVYVAPSLHDPCSNAVLEALACGLPVAYRRSGGHPELVGDAGLPFDEPGELAPVLAQLASELEERRAAIRVPALAEVCDRYLEVLAG
jgi:glycosyltransferase involved in cell wall biosynthesis